jgi:hypothetical protein
VRSPLEEEEEEEEEGEGEEEGEKQHQEVVDLPQVEGDQFQVEDAPPLVGVDHLLEAAVQHQEEEEGR